MFRLIGFVLALGIAVYKTVYGGNKKDQPQPQTTNQPMGKKPAVKPLPLPKPEVILGEPLTDEEWELIKQSSHVLN
jgi:hypothetical protein